MWICSKALGCLEPGLGSSTTDVDQPLPTHGPFFTSPSLLFQSVFIPSTLPKPLFQPDSDSSSTSLLAQRGLDPYGGQCMDMHWTSTGGAKILYETVGQAQVLVLTYCHLGMYPKTCGSIFFLSKTCGTIWVFPGSNDGKNGVWPLNWRFYRALPWHRPLTQVVSIGTSIGSIYCSSWRGPEPFTFMMLKPFRLRM